jgi:nucleoside-diphosphate-sugar epimerase
VLGIAQLAALGAAPDSGRKHLPALVRFGTARTRYAMDKARDLLGWQPRTDLLTGIGKCEGWLRDKGLLK